MSQDAVFDETKDREEVQHSLNRLRWVNTLRYASLPIAALGAAVATATAPIAFPIIAGVAAAAVGLGELVARRERAQLDLHLKSLTDHQVLDKEEVSRISSSANTVSVAGSSN